MREGRYPPTPWRTTLWLHGSCSCSRPGEGQDRRAGRRISPGRWNPLPHGRVGGLDLQHGLHQRHGLAFQMHDMDHLPRAWGLKIEDRFRAIDRQHLAALKMIPLARLCHSMMVASVSLAPWAGK